MYYRNMSRYFQKRQLCTKKYNIALMRKELHSWANFRVGGIEIGNRYCSIRFGTGIPFPFNQKLVNRLRDNITK